MSLVQRDNVAEVVPVIVQLKQQKLYKRGMMAFGRDTHARLAANQFVASSIAKQMARALASGRVSIDPDEATQVSTG